MPDRPREKVAQMIQCAAVLAVDDVRASCAFYRDRLGFTNDYGDERYGVVWRDNAAVHFKQGSPADAIELFFWVEDVDGFHAELRERGVEAPEPVTQPYQIREFILTDPAGNALRFGQDAY